MPTSAPKFSLREFHHGYLGIALLVAGHRSPLLLALGTILLADDALQHLAEALLKVPSPSPLHLLGSWCYLRWAWYRKLNNFLDKLFGKR